MRNRSLTRLPSATMTLMLLTLCMTVYGQSDIALNFAPSGQATGSSYNPGHPARLANDGVIQGGSYWETQKNFVKLEHTQPLRGQWLELSWKDPKVVGSIQLYSGFTDTIPLRTLQFEYYTENSWRVIPGTVFKTNTKSALRIVLDHPVKSARFRVVSSDHPITRIYEIMLFPPVIFGDAPPLIFDEKGIAKKETTPLISDPDKDRHYAMVNQTGYTQGWPKRFTAPQSPDGSTFELIETGRDSVVYSGKITGGIGDFTSFTPGDFSGNYLIRLSGQGKKEGRSYDFKIKPMFFQQMSLEPALRFMVDARSYLGTHPSAFGGHPFRDGTYYTYELPSLVMLYMSNPSYFDQADVEIVYEKDKKRILDPNFWYTNEPRDKGAFEDSKRYYKELDAPVGDRVPDLIQLLHWVIGYYLMHPLTLDGSAPEYRLEPQVLEQFAFFLYAFPSYQKYFSPDFHKRATTFAFDNWEKLGLLKVNKEIGDFKGRETPGHTIAPNLMMYEVAKRLGRTDAQRYLKAAIAQSEWLVKEVDPADIRITKGQRMNEHRLSTGLFFLNRLHPEINVKGLDKWTERLTSTMLQRSRNMYDYRKYSDDSWTIPASTVKWNDPGSVAGFAGVAVALSSLIENPKDLADLQILKASHIDNLFGRNPLNACATRHVKDFEGADIGWPKFDRWDVCARIELIRGAISSTPSHEQYPFNPTGGFRHPEGWTTFNSAFNISIAFTSWEAIKLTAESLGDDIQIQLVAPANMGKQRGELYVDITTENGIKRQLLTETGVNTLTFKAVVNRKDFELTNGEAASVIYGFGPFAHHVKLP